MKRTVFLSILAVLTCVFVLSASVFADTGLANFTAVNTYEPGHFTDVDEGQWYAKNVKTAYELGLFVGSGDVFNPDGNISVAETLAVASRLHNTYFGNGESFEEGSPWYQVYVDYALDNSLIAPDPFADYKAKATRAQFSSILAKAVDDSVFTVINTVDDDAVPDVPMTAPYAEDVYKLYRAGILVGNDAKGTFTPDSNIKRSAVAAIVTRIVDTDLRESITLRDAALWEDGFKKPFRDHEDIVAKDEDGFEYTAGAESSLLKTDDRFCYWNVLTWDPASGETEIMRTEKDPASSKVWALDGPELQGAEDMDALKEEDWALIRRSPGGEAYDDDDIAGAWEGINGRGRPVKWYIKPDSDLYAYEWLENDEWHPIIERMEFNGVSFTMYDEYYSGGWKDFDSVDWGNIASYVKSDLSRFVIESVSPDAINYYNYTGPDYDKGTLNTRVRDDSGELSSFIEFILLDIKGVASMFISNEFGVEAQIDSPVRFCGYVEVDGGYYPLFSLYQQVMSDGSYLGTFELYAALDAEDIHYYYKKEAAPGRE